MTMFIGKDRVVFIRIWFLSILTIISRQKDWLQSLSQITPLGVDIIQSRRVPLKYIRRMRTYMYTHVYVCAHMCKTVYPVLDVLWRGVLGSCGAYQDEGWQGVRGVVGRGWLRRPWPIFTQWRQAVSPRTSPDSENVVLPAMGHRRARSALPIAPEIHTTCAFLVHATRAQANNCRIKFFFN